MRIINGLEELKALVGQEIGTSEWLKVEQSRIQQFADATNDHQWIHLDVERAKKESPFGGPIAHGFLTLSLLPDLLDKIWEIKGVKMGVNYGLNKVRFTAPVPSGSNVRLKATLSELQEKGSAVQLMVTAEFQVEGQEKPACIAESLMRLYL